MGGDVLICENGNHFSNSYKRLHTRLREAPLVVTEEVPTEDNNMLTTHEILALI